MNLSLFFIIILNSCTILMSSLTLPPLVEHRIIGGEEVTIQQYPYQLSLLLNGSHVCGATLIGPRAVITGAHCIFRPVKNYSVRAGSDVLNRGGIVRSVRRTVRHPKYNRVDYDIAVVLLSTPLTLAQCIQPVGLPAPNQDPPVGSGAVATGWGLTKSADRNSSSAKLRRAVLTVFSQDSCRRSYGTYSITDRMMCAGDKDGTKDACRGDSGGPLVANGKLIGVISWGIDCGDRRYPGVYTRVARVRGFIKNYTGI